MNTEIELEEKEDLISQLVYKHTSFWAKLLLLIVGGPHASMKCLLKRDWTGAFFAPASNCFSVAHSAHTVLMSQENDSLSFWEKNGWKILRLVGSVYAVIFGEMAILFKVPLSENNWDVLAAQALGLRKNGELAKSRTLLGLERFPESLLLQRRLAQCYIGLKDNMALRECLLSIEDKVMCQQIRENDPVMFVRIAVTEAQGWLYLGEPLKMKKWKDAGIKEATKLGIKDQLAKLEEIR